MVEYKTLSEGGKWAISFWSGLLFFVMASPLAYAFFNEFFKRLGFEIIEDRRPYIYGILIHAILFAIFIRIMMFINLPGTTEQFKQKKNGSL